MLTVYLLVDEYEWCWLVLVGGKRLEVESERKVEAEAQVIGKRQDRTFSEMQGQPRDPRFLACHQGCKSM